MCAQPLVLSDHSLCKCSLLALPYAEEQAVSSSCTHSRMSRSCLSNCLSVPCVLYVPSTFSMSASMSPSPSITHLGDHLHGASCSPAPVPLTFSPGGCEVILCFTHQFTKPARSGPLRQHTSALAFQKPRVCVPSLHLLFQCHGFCCCLFLSGMPVSAIRNTSSI